MSDHLLYEGRVAIQLRFVIQIKKHAQPKLEIATDTLTGTLRYAGQLVAMGTMTYKHVPRALDETHESLRKMQVNLKLVSGVDGKPEVAQLVTYNLTDITVKGSWTGPARLHLVPHVNAPVADLPVKRVLGGQHFIVDLTLPHGRVVSGQVYPGSRRCRHDRSFTHFAHSLLLV